MEIKKSGIFMSSVPIKLIYDMFRPIKHDKASKHKKSRMLKMNVSVHPFVLIAIIAALTVVVFVIVVYYFKYLK
jgi:hypothetical protein